MVLLVHALGLSTLVPMYENNDWYLKDAKGTMYTGQHCMALYDIMPLYSLALFSDTTL